MTWLNSVVSVMHYGKSLPSAKPCMTRNASVPMNGLKNAEPRPSEKLTQHYSGVWKNWNMLCLLLMEGLPSAKHKLNVSSLLNLMP